METDKGAGAGTGTGQVKVSKQRKPNEERTQLISTCAYQTTILESGESRLKSVRALESQKRAPTQQRLLSIVLVLVRSACKLQVKMSSCWLRSLALSRSLISSLSLSVSL